MTVEASDVFCGLPPADLKALQAIARERTFAEGEEIFKEGDAGDGLYLIQDGCVEISGMLADKHRHVFSRVQAGDLVARTAVGVLKPFTPLAPQIAVGLRVFTCGHSFHVWVPAIVADLCKKAGIPNHVQVGVSSIGGSRVIQHWTTQTVVAKQSKGLTLPTETIHVNATARFAARCFHVSCPHHRRAPPTYSQRLNYDN